MKILSVLIVVTPLLFINGCFTGPATLPGLPGQVPAENMRIKGTIVKFMEDVENDSCTNCNASVRIDSIEGFGPRVKAAFSGDTINVKFMYSLNPFKFDSAEEEPEKSLPGLKLNDIFRGDIECVMQNDGNCIYRIFWYVRVNH
jgi:hypothetical protein